jgi:peroxiredoxin
MPLAWTTNRGQPASPPRERNPAMTDQHPTASKRSEGRVAEAWCAPSDIHRLPANLPVPLDDGAADHLCGRPVPGVCLPTTTGLEVDLADVSRGMLVLYVYPRTGVPGEPIPPGWMETPGAFGCTTENCAFRDRRDDFGALGTSVFGLSAQDLQEQREFAQREEIPYPLLNDSGLRLADALALPTFEAAGLCLYRRLTLVADAGRIAKVFYPVFPPDRHPYDVIAWLSQWRSDTPERRKNDPSVKESS